MTALSANAHISPRRQRRKALWKVGQYGKLIRKYQADLHLTFRLQCPASTEHADSGGVGCIYSFLPYPIPDWLRRLGWRISQLTFGLRGQTGRRNWAVHDLGCSHQSDPHS